MRSRQARPFFVARAGVRLRPHAEEVWHRPFGLRQTVSKHKAGTGHATGRPRGRSRAPMLAFGLRAMWPPLRKLGESFELAANQSLLLRARPALDLSLCLDRIGDPIEPLREDQGDGTALRRIAAECSGVVLSHPQLKRRAGRPNVITAISTQQDLKIGAAIHG